MCRSADAVEKKSAFEQPVETFFFSVLSRILVGLRKSRLQASVSLGCGDRLHLYSAHGETLLVEHGLLRFNRRLLNIEIRAPACLQVSFVSLISLVSGLYACEGLSSCLCASSRMNDLRTCRIALADEKSVILSILRSCFVQCTLDVNSKSQSDLTVESALSIPQSARLATNQ